MPWRRCQPCCLTFFLSASGCTQSSWSIENGKNILSDLVLAAEMLCRTHLTKRHCRLPAVGTHGHIPSCAGTSTFAQDRISMRMTRRMGSTRPHWQRSHPWGPPALPQGWSILSWGPALHSEFLPRALLHGCPEYMRRDVFLFLAAQSPSGWEGCMAPQPFMGPCTATREKHTLVGLPFASVAPLVACCMRDCLWNSTDYVQPGQPEWKRGRRMACWAPAAHIKPPLSSRAVCQGPVQAFCRP